MVFTSLRMRIQMGRSSDSGRETGAISDSSFEATINKKWIELKDTSFDIGIGSDRSRKSKRNDRGKMHGSYNQFQTTKSSGNPAA